MEIFMKDKIFGVLQRVGRSFMLPIAILPIAGLFLGIGGSFTNETMLNAYGLSGLMGEGTVIYDILLVLNASGSVVFDNLPLIFAIGVAIGMAKQEKEVAALSGAIAFLIMHASIGALISAAGGSDKMLAGSVTQVLGITSLQMGVFGGIIVGLGVAALHNKYYKIQLPQVLSFFGGTRFVPIISSVVYLLVGILMFFIWPTVQKGINVLGSLVLNSGYIGTCIYGILERALIPFGLHHVFYLPFWQTAVGGTATVGGTVVEGAQNIFFAELAVPGIKHFNVEATRFMAGKFPFMIFGLPGAALAMYACAKPEKRKTAGGLFLSAALTAMLTGITEPIEFTFLFVAPLLYGIHCVLAGLSYMLMHILNVGVGMTFSGGLIDMFLFGIMQGNAKTDWINIVWVGLIYFAVYYLLFSRLIKTFGYITPGRETDNDEIKLYTRKDVEAKKGGNTPQMSDEISEIIVNGLGGADNISDIDCCATRLRITVKSQEQVSDVILKQSGCAGIVKNGNGVQIIYGPKVTIIKSKLSDYMDALKLTDSSAVVSIPIPSPMSGRTITLEATGDSAFSVLGEGVAIEPENGKVYSPFDGIVENLVSTHHAIGLKSDFGTELLIHVGIDTVKLNGKFFTPHVKEGDSVYKGQLLLDADISEIQKAGFKTYTPIIVISGNKIKNIKQGKVKVSETLFETE